MLIVHLFQLIWSAEVMGEGHNVALRHVVFFFARTCGAAGSASL